MIRRPPRSTLPYTTLFRSAFTTRLAEDRTPDASGRNVLRIKGGGESGITPALPVVVNAVVDALRPLGVADVELPLRSEEHTSELQSQSNLVCRRLLVKTSM